MLLYYITDRTQFPGDENSRRHALLRKIAEAARCGVDLIQLREKDLATRELETLALAAVRTIRENSPRTRLLINSRTDVALSCGADGVHLRSDDVSPTEVRAVWERGRDAPTGEKKTLTPCIAVSCHTLDAVTRAASEAADFVVFAPVFEKKTAPGTPLAEVATLREACHGPVPVLALGGITLDNAQICVAAGAAGVAGIRLFQENDIAEVARKLRG